MYIHQAHFTNFTTIKHSIIMIAIRYRNVCRIPCILACTLAPWLYDNLFHSSRNYIKPNCYKQSTRTITTIASTIGYISNPRPATYAMMKRYQRESSLPYHCRRVLPFHQINPLQDTGIFPLHMTFTFK